ncbi:MAG: hypothetical protein ACK4SX_14340 [Alcanivoracaceae bacterium]
MKKKLHFATEYRQRRERKLHKRRLRKVSIVLDQGISTAYAKCPEHLTLYKLRDRSEFLEMLQQLRLTVADGKRRIRIDFSCLNSIDASAAILLRAEIERIKKLYPKLVVRGIYPRNVKCAHVLAKIGVSKLCGMPQKIGNFDDVVHWSVVTGEDVDGEKYATELMAPYEGRLLGDLDKRLYVGVSEAMTNVTHHAYIDARDDGLADTHEDERQWWMFSQERKGQLQVVICDLGIGIPRTLPRSQKPELAPVVRWMRKESRQDADVLSAVLKKTAGTRPVAQAPEDTFSRTGQVHRGRGLYNIVHAVRDIDKASIAVLSNSGGWIKSTDGDKGGAKVRFNDNIKGTIISWSIPIGPHHEKQDD